MTQKGYIKYKQCIWPSSECQSQRYVPPPSSSAPPTLEPGWGRPACGNGSALTAAHTEPRWSKDACCQILHWVLCKNGMIRRSSGLSVSWPLFHKVRKYSMCTYSVTEVFPMGAFARKSLAIGFTHRINTMTGDRKLMCSRILQETIRTSERAKHYWCYVFNNIWNICLLRYICIRSYWMSGRPEFICTASRWVWASRSPGKARRAPM